MYGSDLLARLADLGLPDGDWALFGSGPLLARGWITAVNDLDVIARGAAWEAARPLGTLVHLDEFDVDVIEIEPAITIGRDWGIGDADIDELIDTAELVDGIPCVLLDHVILYKRIIGRPKDHEHLRIIAERLGPAGA